MNISRMLKTIKDNNQNTRKTPDKKKAVVQQVVVKEERKKASASSVAYAEYLVCPYDSPNIVHAPSPVPVRETTVRQNIVVDLAGFSNNGEFNIEVRPHLSDTLSITATATDVQDQGNFAIDIASTGITNTATRPETSEITHLSTGYQAGVLKIAAPVGGSTRTAFPMNNTAAAVVYTMTIECESSESIGATVLVEAVAASGSWATLATVVMVVTELGGSGTASVTIPASCLGIAFSISSGTFSGAYLVPVQFGISLVYSSGAGLMALGKETNTYSTFGLPLQAAITDLRSWRVTAQDLLVTYQGDTLNDGGAIASARVPAYWAGGSATATGNWYTDILQLSYDRYDGALKHGTHVHWIPGSINDLTPINDPRDDHDFGYFKMVAAGTMTHPASSVRVRVSTTIAFFSTDPSYGQMNWAPPPTDLGLMLQYVARVVPAATQNDTHAIKKMAAFAGKNFKEGVKYLFDNPETCLKWAAICAAFMA